MNDTTRVLEAIDNIKRSDPVYWSATLRQRLPGGAGSIFPGFGSETELEGALRAANWYAYEPQQGRVDGCEYYRTEDITGLMGVVELSRLRPDAEVLLEDRKDVGTVSCSVRGVPRTSSGFTVLIVGMEDGVPVAFTFHPGDPVRPSEVGCEGLATGTTTTVARAAAMGLLMAKVI